MLSKNNDSLWHSCLRRFPLHQPPTQQDRGSAEQGQSGQTMKTGGFASRIKGRSLILEWWVTHMLRCALSVSDVPGGRWAGRTNSSSSLRVQSWLASSLPTQRCMEAKRRHERNERKVNTSADLNMPWTLNVLPYPHADPLADEKSYYLKTFEHNHCPLTYADRKATPRKPCLKMKTILSVCVCVYLSSYISIHLYEMSTEGEFIETESRGWKQEFNDK